ncbi:hypothetical protein A3F07_04970 [candidate division WWE3 bacterium RIFCSPHIGHO2_12_FULL_38_15]|uniref:Uncharacterized protein n=1 Tax=candidate division WWE3 bacterium RIFCSPHIGHO2_02_FULL_38_14 TaxID=1802620 RepID=A0A1F4V706_UNCKA|nr:MAG: hypothetical protein A2793_02520 [candidate division WWE3 bacterium RIFCSPHIGHO2_01_FULL_38_45]OGC48213.1 MAG: hypothetical protein A3F07_04970 [candidate division WWE3 bacterium RIFCSPHIGHO2_12_FULL_38_15]OGC52444.1 MAG: hypothetical protein A3B64_00075 [candidate division WWE3 bacterium RIFCSPLOWO2_01_FULL_37_24]OGC52982.1 MAG: hypothetical protein A3D91_01555 [candidate division WWE3 bacterium RIFCSPHIGHO2_02_FULL_38_14]
MALHFVSKVCVGCGNGFQTSNNSDKCYNCTLDDITHGNPPEEGDFNTARIVSGTLSAQERNYLQQDLESAELGRTTEEDTGDEEEDDDWEYDENEDARLGHEG